MVDVARRTPGLSTAHAAGLRRLSVRASAASSAAAAASPTSLRPSTATSLLSFAPLADAVVSRLAAAGVAVHPGLADADLARLEAELAFSFPPDLRAVLAAGVPAGPGFPDWRCPGLDHLRSALALPVAAVSLQIASGRLWPRSWGAKPHDPAAAMRAARARLKTVPTLIPVFNRCYIPASAPPLAGNPVFFVDETHVVCCGFDLADFFHRFGSEATQLSRRSLDASGRPPRWIEFWSDASDPRRRRSSSSRSRSSSSSASDGSSPEKYYEIYCRRAPPAWVGEYLGRVGLVLREGGWGETDVREMCHGDASELAMVDDVGVEQVVLVDREAVMDLLVVRAERLSGELRRAGWSSGEVAEALGLGGRLEKVRKSAMVSPEMVERMGRIGRTWETGHTFLTT